MLPTRRASIANAIIEMLKTNWQRKNFSTVFVTRSIADCDLTYSSDRRVEPEPEIGVDGNEEAQEFTLHTVHPLTGGEARAVEAEVYNATSHNLVLDIDPESKCWGMKLEQVACHA